MSDKPDWIQNHIEQYKRDPESGHMWDSSVVGGPGPVPCLLLTTEGRKSGKKRTTPLIYGEHQDGYLIVASKGGAPSHPAWYLNLKDNSRVELQVAHKELQAEAEELEGEARSQAWEKMAEIWPDYNTYQEKTEREIPVILLKPV